ncbi:xanthine dehydrogenase small subunit [Polynucleobacter kasalickyi]|uniref:Xanthine dehydrogenase small subunit n=1 Tax=Polynucleobacter kasalickyi TaxID=1938817 RepID=A0A1W2BC51_9BURK|nr:xanthine dehydrogenase small subunit [Polynucleobacter kasalickyi]SMC70414.1 xanthine dehydrogenase small subunit [Polynucleobacter kasalickyi]
MIPKSSQTIQFYLDDELIQLPVENQQETLLDFIRLQTNNTSVKEGCGEGDCGACMVLQAQTEQGKLVYKTVNSCIKFVPGLHKKSIYTAKYISQSLQELHPVQQAMVTCHGSQCGFCTPGFVISLLAHYLDGESKHAHEDDVINAISGNLCRCTGYRPIIEAGLQMQELPEPMRFSRADAFSEKRLQQQIDLELQPDLVSDLFIAPSDLETFASVYVAHPEYQILAGGTDVGLWVTQHLKQLKPILFIGEVKELQQIKEQDQSIWIGAGVNLEDAFKRIVHHFPDLEELHQRFASLPIRKSGTLCGNVANGSPIGDSMPILIALNTRVVLRQGQTTREMNLEDFYLGYQQKNLQPGEFVEAVKIPLPTTNERIASYKVSKRFEQDISAICFGAKLVVENGLIQSIRVAFGGMAATPKRAILLENYLINKPWSLSVIQDAQEIIEQDFAPLSDLRASANYRTTVAKNLLVRFYNEVNQSGLSLHDFSPIISEAHANE